MATEPSVVLVVGSGGREHALAWALAKSPSVTRVLVAPGNGGTAAEPGLENAPVAAADLNGLAAVAAEAAVDLVVIGPETALQAGLADHLRAAGLAVFGPNRRAARIETSKAWARGFMARQAIPHPGYVVADTREAAEKAVLDLDGACVIKADGLAAGKGVTVLDGDADPRPIIDSYLAGQAFGSAGHRVVIEERLSGRELSVMAITDGRDYVLLAPAQDHKRLLDGDQGPNTGGMGAIAPAPLATPDLMTRVGREVVEPALAGLASEVEPFVGCLYAGLMIDGDRLGVIEFNARFGDPETQVQVPLVQGDLARCLAAAARGRLATEAAAIQVSRAHCVGVVAAMAGYPGDCPTGRVVLGIEAAEANPGIKVFHAGTKASPLGTVTAGGRVATVTCTAPSLEAARLGVYRALGESGLHFDGLHYRRDIGRTAVESAR